MPVISAPAASNRMRPREGEGAPSADIDCCAPSPTPRPRLIAARIVGVMAGDKVAGLGRNQVRHGLGADLGSPRAARAERAARWWIERRGEIALEHDPRPVALLVGV